MGDSYLGARLNALRTAQNPDGGWSYFPGKRSWLEPTAYAALALHREPAADQAWALLKSWQAADGSWRPSAEVRLAHWATALCVTLAIEREDFGDAFVKGVKWLLDSAGNESTVMKRAAARIGLLDTDRDLRWKGWSWTPNTTSWVEPTAHALVALKKAWTRQSTHQLSERVRMGEAQLLDVRCRDGGWNYGSRSARSIDLPSYPETTALALVGLQGRSDVAPLVETAQRMALRPLCGPMARAWLVIALRLHGAEVPQSPNSAPSADVLIEALEALSSAEGNWGLLRTGGLT